MQCVFQTFPQEYPNNVNVSVCVRRGVDRATAVTAYGAVGTGKFISVHKDGSACN